MPATIAEAPSTTPATTLNASQLRRRCDPAELPFTTTAELPDSPVVFGQERAVAAIQFGIGIRRHGYNIFALGPTGAGKHAIVRRFLEEQARSEPPARDWCYVHNFDQPHRPRAISLPKGAGAKFRSDVSLLVEELRTAISAALETEEYRQHHQEIHDEFSTRRDRALEDLRTRAAKRGVALIRSPLGLALVPMRNGQVIDADAFQQLAEDEQRGLGAAIEEFEAELGKILREVPRWHRETHEKLRALKRAATETVVAALLEELKKDYDAEAGVQSYLASFEKDVIDNADDFRKSKEGEEDAAGPLDALLARTGAAPPLGRYQVNVLDDHGPAPGAPVVYEDKPTFQNLVGRIEHVAQMGTLVTDFTHIKAGALHKANGGYLILNARRVLLEPFAWEGLKRALRARAIRIESLGEALSLVSTVSLDAEAIPLDVKVVLVGDRLLYYLLHEFDPDFRELFKVAVDFESTTDRGEPGNLAYAGVVATLARKASLRPFAASAVARVIEHGSRMVEDAGKVWIELDGLTDLLREADYWAGQAGHAAVDVDDVQRAIDARIHRASRPRERLLEDIARGTIMIGTEGAVVGQVNGLSVIELGGFAFGRPSRITARVRLGSGTVVDIEREVELGGPIHSKGVLILSGFLAGRYVPDQPLSLSASIVFEQSYGAVEGDSASSAELYALLSALADVPVRQSIAVTGSVNQHGVVQPVGGINEKIEGFFDVCRAKGLTGDQGVLIPAANLRHLMLRDDVIEAVEAGTFHVYAAGTVDQGIEVLTGVPAGTRDAAGRFPGKSVNGLIEQRLAMFAKQARAFRTGAVDSKTSRGIDSDGDPR
ncbi:MAG: Lon protease family protein [Betaproteobacteria bacterium]